MLIVGWVVIGSTIGRQHAAAVLLGERDLRIALGAAHFADGTLALFIVWLVVALVALPEHSRTWLRPFAAAIVPIALVIARTPVEKICTAWRFRRERG